MPPLPPLPFATVASPPSLTIVIPGANAIAIAPELTEINPPLNPLPTPELLAPAEFRFKPG